MVRTKYTAFAITILGLAATMGFALDVCGTSKKEAMRSAQKSPESKERVRLDRKPSPPAHAGGERPPEPPRDRADGGQQPAPAKSREETAAAEEERLLVEELVTAKAKDLLSAQTEKRIEAERAFELASQRYEAGTGTRADFLNAEAAVVEARRSFVDALWDYALASGMVIPEPGADLKH